LYIAYSDESVYGASSAWITMNQIPRQPLSVSKSIRTSVVVSF
jgi:hypothetical protein